MDIKSMWTSVTMKANSSWYMVPGAILVAKPTRQSFFVTYQRVTKGGAKSVVIVRLPMGTPPRNTSKISQ